jgi:hypothetical protein
LFFIAELFLRLLCLRFVLAASSSSSDGFVSVDGFFPGCSFVSVFFFATLPLPLVVVVVVVIVVFFLLGGGDAFNNLAAALKSISSVFASLSLLLSAALPLRAPEAEED